MSLAERLRALVIMDEVGSDNPLGREAADRIEALEEATRLRLSKDTLNAVKAWRDALGAMGSRTDRITAHGLDVLVKREEALAALDAGA